MNLTSYLKERKSWVEAALTASVRNESIPEALRNAMIYSLEAGGKRLRPILVIASAEAVGGNVDKVMHAAIAMEMIHTFSLIHDDLPAMDDDSLRRGKPTNHKVFGEAFAILAGDALLAQAFYVLTNTSTNLNSTATIEVIRDIAKATGGCGMTGGQALDIEATGKKITESELTKLHLCKTGALITASVTSGAKLCGADSSQVLAFSKYGDSIGLAFQITDDLLDIEGNESVIGKDIGSDESKGKSTYPAIIGVEASRQRAKNLVNDAIQSLSSFDEKAEPLRLIAKYIIERDR